MCKHFLSNNFPTAAFNLLSPYFMLTQAFQNMSQEKVEQRLIGETR